MKKILLIDDDQGVRTLLSQLVKRDGWEVIEAEDGERGVELAVEQVPDVVLCDLLMPRCNGFQVCRAIRKHEHLAGTKIIVTSGRDYETDRLNAIESGAQRYILKPFNLPELLQLLNQLISREAGTEIVAANPRTGSVHRAVPPASTEPDRPPKVRFWGVRGSIPVPGPGTVYYGGNTSCVEVRADGEIIVLDAGTGIRGLGRALKDEFKDQPINITLLITHTHWDHIQGFPYFLPAYDPKNNLRVLGYEGAREGLASTLSGQMESPYFPIGMKQMPGDLAIEELRDLTFHVGRVRVDATFVNHPGICVGYRLTTSSGTIAYLPDNEPFQRFRSQIGKPSDRKLAESMKYAQAQDEKLIEFIRDVDVLITDAQYDDAEYQTHAGWGHACVDDVVALAIIARVKRLYLFHHDPDHSDAQISRMVAWARELVALHDESVAVEAAREGLEITLIPRTDPAVAAAAHS